MKRLLVVAVVLVAIVAFGIWLLLSSDGTESAPDGYRKVEGFNYIEPGEPACLALTPACGFCPGIVVEKECFIPAEQGDPELLEP